jgi:hypothetical protein
MPIILCSYGMPIILCSYGMLITHLTLNYEHWNIDWVPSYWTLMVDWAMIMMYYERWWAVTRIAFSNALFIQNDGCFCPLLIILNVGTAWWSQTWRRPKDDPGRRSRASCTSGIYINVWKAPAHRASQEYFFGYLKIGSLAWKCKWAVYTQNCLLTTHRGEKNVM